MSYKHDATTNFSIRSQCSTFVPQVAPSTSPFRWRLVVSTQYRENYGAHCWNGEGDCPQYWKSKGHYEYVYCALNQKITKEEARKILKGHMDLFNYKGDYAEEYVIAYSLMSPGDFTEHELWDAWDQNSDASSPHERRGVLGIDDWGSEEGWDMSPSEYSTVEQSEPFELVSEEDIAALWERSESSR